MKKKKKKNHIGMGRVPENEVGRGREEESFPENEVGRGWGRDKITGRGWGIGSPPQTRPIAIPTFVRLWI